MVKFNKKMLLCLSLILIVLLSGCVSLKENNKVFLDSFGDPLVDALGNSITSDYLYTEEELLDFARERHDVAKVLEFREYDRRTELLLEDRLGFKYTVSSEVYTNLSNVTYIKKSEDFEEKYFEYYLYPKCIEYINFICQKENLEILYFNHQSFLLKDNNYSFSNYKAEEYCKKLYYCIDKYDKYDMYYAYIYVEHSSLNDDYIYRHFESEEDKEMFDEMYESVQKQHPEMFP